MSSLMLRIHVISAEFPSRWCHCCSFTLMKLLLPRFRWQGHTITASIHGSLKIVFLVSWFITIWLCVSPNSWNIFCIQSEIAYDIQWEAQFEYRKFSLCGMRDLIFHIAVLSSDGKNHYVLQFGQNEQTKKTLHVDTVRLSLSKWIWACICMMCLVKRVQMRWAWHQNWYNCARVRLE